MFKHGRMIKSFGCKYTEKIFYGFFVKKFPEYIQVIARRKLLMINASIDFRDLLVPPSNRLEKLVKKGIDNLYSIRINDQWRICFYFDNGDSYDVSIIDYH